MTRRHTNVFVHSFFWRKFGTRHVGLMLRISFDAKDGRGWVRARTICRMFVQPVKAQFLIVWDLIEIRGNRSSPNEDYDVIKNVADAGM